MGIRFGKDGAGKTKRAAKQGAARRFLKILSMF
jgi:hypothetical protein